MQVKTILNIIEKHKGFVYEHGQIVGQGPDKIFEIPVRPQARSKARPSPKSPTGAARRWAGCLIRAVVGVRCPLGATGRRLLEGSEGLAPM